MNSSRDKAPPLLEAEVNYLGTQAIYFIRDFMQRTDASSVAELRKAIKCLESMISGIELDLKDSDYLVLPIV